MKKKNKENEVFQIPIDLIKNFDNSRLRLDDDEDVASLMTDIRHRGLLQPIGILKEGNNYIIRFGNRRLLACKKLGWKTISAILSDRDLNEDSFMADNIAENYHRKQMSPIEIAEQCKSYKARGYSLSEIAVLFTMPVGKIEKAIKVEESSPKAFKDIIRYTKAGKHAKQGKISLTAANEIVSLGLNDESKQALFAAARKEDLTGSQIRLIKRLMMGGLSLEKSLQTYKDYKSFSVEIPLKIVELKKYEMSNVNFFKGLLNGSIKPNIKLL